MDDHGLGASYLGNGQCHFEVWAPLARQVDVHIVAPTDRIVPLLRGDRGYFRGVIGETAPGTRYFYRLDGQKDRPDPASRHQPEGVHCASEVVAADFAWHDQHWRGLALADYVIYELHVGTFTPEGTFDAIVDRLAYLKDLGITALELMPIAQFPGCRNWGYDGVYPFAAQHSYGGPSGLKRLVDACHQQELAVILDVVYNHLGPEGNYLAEFAPYFTDRYRTPWGRALNFDGPWSDEVRRFFIESARSWLADFHVDALRLDAIHAIYDFSAFPFLEELGVEAHQLAEQLNRRIYLIAESNLNDVRIIRPRELGGIGLDAQWCDDFHHAVHALLTDERHGYYEDFGEVEHLTRAFHDGFVYQGNYSPYRQRRHGNRPTGTKGWQFVVCAQNHDQIGNRVHGNRLSEILTFERLKLAAGLVTLSPFLPMLFMGEEYGETVPFQYFISHSDPELVEAVRQGRREEFAAFHWEGKVPDPQAEATFHQCKLAWEKLAEPRHRSLHAFYRELLRLRRKQPALANLSKEEIEVSRVANETIFFVRRWHGSNQALAAFNVGNHAVTASAPEPASRWKKLLDSSDEQWLGPGSGVPDDLESNGAITLALPAWSFVLFRNVEARS
ncbi:MAG TPA: malto-oligosyltrehalose trehalohydrolase [Chloroflexota bacterium]|nr:malto-oligosyltrehalose trehalohydrolase [Chloroflexota bacterium]